MPKKLPLERLRELLSYSPETGVISRNGKKVGKLHKFGYTVISLDGAYYMGHRIAWALHTGSQPPDEIDHENGVRSDNRWTNLRVVPGRSENQQNMLCKSRLGIPGAYENRGWFYSKIRTPERDLSLGRFNTAREAFEAYFAAKAKFHPYCNLARLRESAEKALKVYEAL